MNRTIKFRGKDIETGNWVYGYYVCLEDYFRKPINGKERITHRIYSGSADTCTSENGYDFTPSWYEVDPDTVSQFTGLHDKNGNEIYEGDIIYSEFNDGSNTNCLIEWNEEKACFGLMDDSEYKYKMNGYDFPHFDNTILNNFMKNSKKFEIVGNIFDNKDLMEK